MGIFWLIVGAILAAGPACERPVAVRPTRVVAISGDNQCHLPGEVLDQPLVVRVFGPRKRDFALRSVEGPPVPNGRVRFRVERLSEYRASAEEAERPGDAGLPPFPTLYAKREEAETGPAAASRRRLDVTTDATGRALVWVRLGTDVSDWRVEAVVYDEIGETVEKEHFRIVSGVRKLVDISEATVREEIPLRLQVAAWDPETGGHRPLSNRVVYFRIVGEPYGVREPAEISNRRDVTDADGMRGGTEVTLGDRPGIYHVLAEVEPGSDPKDDASGHLRGILFRIVASDWYLTVAKLIGGSLLFLLGVRLLAGGFILILSPYLHFESGPWTENRAFGYLGGGLLGVTFESSSTVTSHLVSFANGGQLTARGGWPLLLGASLGATVLPQFLSLELGFLAAPALAVGLLCILLPRRKGADPWGWVFVGAGLILTSWNQISDGVGLLSLSDGFHRDFLPGVVSYAESFSQYAPRFLSTLAMGFALGFVLRTSNLLVVFGILLSHHGLLRVESCVPLIIGANLGAAALLFVRSSLKSVEARRLAATGLAFHVVTTALLVVASLITVRGAPPFLWLVEVLTPGQLLHPSPEAAGHHVATVHSMYNLVGGLLCLAVPKLVFWAVDRWLPPDNRSRSGPRALDDNLIPVPSLALRQVRQDVAFLLDLARKNFTEAFDAFRYADLDVSAQVVRREETIAGLHRDITRYLLLVAENQLSRRDAAAMEVLQSTASGIHRIGEVAEQLEDLASRRIEESVGSYDETDRELSEVYDVVIAQFDNVASLVQRREQRVEENVMKLTERLAKIRTRLETQWRQRLEDHHARGDDPAVVHLQTSLYQEAFGMVFRVAGHLSHIAQRMRIVAMDV